MLEPCRIMTHSTRNCCSCPSPLLTKWLSKNNWPTTEMATNVCCPSFTLAEDQQRNSWCFGCFSWIFFKKLFFNLIFTASNISLVCKSNTQIVLSSNARRMELSAKNLISFYFINAKNDTKWLDAHQHSIKHLWLLFNIHFECFFSLMPTFC